jgi:hypothetical protein
MVIMTATACPFCGVITEIPHETQQACILALNAEIARTREILEQVRESPTADPPANPDAHKD